MFYEAGDGGRLEVPSGEPTAPKAQDSEKKLLAIFSRPPGINSPNLNCSLKLEF